MQLNGSRWHHIRKPAQFMRSIILLIALLALSSCKKELPESDAPNATVLGKGIDCGDIYLIKVDDSIDGIDNWDNTYHAVNLPENLKNPGLRIWVDARPVNENEAIFCTTRGPSYPAIWLNGIK